MNYFDFSSLILDNLENNCEKLPVIPQNLGTCWFNAILMAMIYSDGLSQYIYEKAIENNWQDDDNGAFKTLMLLFMNYVRAIKNGKLDYIDKLKKILNKYKIELILLDYLTYYHKDLLSIYNEIIYSGYKGIYLLYLLNSIGINSSLIVFSKDVFYDNIEYDFINKEYIPSKENIDRPDILLFKIEVNYDISIIYKHESMKANKIIGFGNEVINFKGDMYKLDCIILYDKKIKHIISGLTCNGSKYVYNGWWKKRGSPCNLMPFKWTIDTTNFCLNRMDCNLEKDLKDTDLCFNFKNNERIMVYVKIKDKKEIEKKQVKKINRISFSSYINRLNINEIKKILLYKYIKSLEGKKIEHLKELLKDEYIKSLEGKDIEHLKELLKEEYTIHSLSSENSLSSI